MKSIGSFGLHPSINCGKQSRRDYVGPSKTVPIDLSFIVAGETKTDPSMSSIIFIYQNLKRSKKPKNVI